ncbi:MAG: hypothetical protein AAFP13_14920 [Pseudomonadota bacterium]
MAFVTASLLVVSLALSAPVTLVSLFQPLPPQIAALSGTAREGRAALSGGIALTWRADWSGLVRGRLGADLVLVGPETRIDADAWAGLGGVGMSDAIGRAGPELLALFPEAATCEGSAVVDIQTLRVSRARYDVSGEIRTRAAICRGPGLGEVTVPPLLIALGAVGDGAEARVTSAAREPYAEALLTPDRRARIRIEPAGARLVPGLPSSEPIELELPF